MLRLHLSLLLMSVYERSQLLCHGDTLGALLGGGSIKSLANSLSLPSWNTIVLPLSPMKDNFSTLTPPVAPLPPNPQPTPCARIRACLQSLRFWRSVRQQEIANTIIDSILDKHKPHVYLDCQNERRAEDFICFL